MRSPVIGMVICLLGWLSMACRASEVTVMPTPTAMAGSVVLHIRTPTPGPLTEAQAIALVGEELAARGVAAHKARIVIGENPRRVLVRYSSSLGVDSRAFQPQTVLIALAVARAMVRVYPPIDGGIRLAIMPTGASNVGLKVVIIEQPHLQAWSEGLISDPEFVSRWRMFDITKE